MEKDDSENIKNENNEKLDDTQQQATSQHTLSHQQSNSEREMIITEINSQSGNDNDGNASANVHVSSALPTTVIMTQRHRMITTTGQIR